MNKENMEHILQHSQIPQKKKYLSEYSFINCSLSEFWVLFFFFFYYFLFSIFDIFYVAFFTFKTVSSFFPQICSEQLLRCSALSYSSPLHCMALLCPTLLCGSLLTASHVPASSPKKLCPHFWGQSKHWSLQCPLTCGPVLLFSLTRQYGMVVKESADPSLNIDMTSL